MDRSHVVTYQKYRTADDRAGDLAWASRINKRAVFIADEQSVRARLRDLELSQEERIVCHLLRLPRRYTDVETCGVLPTEEMRRFLRALHAAEVLELAEPDQAKALVPLEIRRAREAVTGEAPKEQSAKRRRRLRPRVYRPPLEGRESKESASSESEPATSDAHSRADEPAQQQPPQDETEIPDEDREFEREVARLFAERREADYFAVLGVGRNASRDEVKRAYIELAKRYHPDRLAGRSFAHPERVQSQIEELFARINEAYKTLSDDEARREYLEQLERGHHEAHETGKKRRRPGEAQVQFKKGLVLLQKRDVQGARRMFAVARELDHADPTYPIYIAWCDYLDEKRPADEREREAQRRLEEIMRETPHAQAAYFLGAMAKRRGDENRAYEHFRKALELDPRHIEAAREVRLHEMRAKRAAAASKEPQRGPGDLLRRLIKGK